MKLFLKKLWRWSLKLLLYLFVFSILWVLVYRWVNPPITYLQIREWANSSEEQQKEWMPIEEISPHMYLAVVSSEDQHYMKHFGLDFGAIEKAVEYNKSHQRKRGASTITQQTAKNVFLWPGRSFIRKGLEVYFSVLMEILWGKERILEVYLNVIETGENTFGVQAASKRYLKKEASKLSRSDAALIAISLPNPKKFRIATPSAYMIKRRDQILYQMRLLGDGYFERHGGL